MHQERKNRHTSKNDFGLLHAYNTMYSNEFLHKPSIRETGVLPISTPNKKSYIGNIIVYLLHVNLLKDKTEA